MKLSERMALIKAGYTKEEIKAFEVEKEEPAASGGSDAGLVKAIGLMADQLNKLQASFTKGAPAGDPAEEENIDAILARLQGSGKEEE